VRAGRPLGGSSAGLAVLGEICYTAHVTARLTSEMAMADPFDNRLTFESGLLHLDLMRGIITDTHFSTRKRLGRLITFVARCAAENKVDRLLGVGVDERTALCIEAGGTGRVITTAPDGRAWLVFPQQPPEVLAAGKPLTYRDLKVVGAGPESMVDMPRRKVTNPAAEFTASVVAGELVRRP
jgi:cyanophycinase-like exopeptidase